MHAAHLTNEQKSFFEENGYLVIKNALSKEEVARWLAVIDRMDAAHRAANKLAGDAFVEIRNAIAKDTELLDLLDYPATFPLVAELMGPALQLNTSHVLVRPPQPAGTEASFKASGWHRDGCAEVYSAGLCPWIYTKIGYFFTDLTQPGRGNLRVIPGSHKHWQPPVTPKGQIDPDGAIEVLTEPGDAVLFQQRLWHAVGPNYSTITRKNIYFGYCYRYIKPLDYVSQPPELIARGTAIQRQLLGEQKHEMTFWIPKEGDVPLKEWLKEHTAMATV